MQRCTFLLLMVAAAGCTELIGPPRVADNSTPESWVSGPQHTWPQLVLTNAASFRGHTPLEGASSFLLQTNDGRVLAATAKHLLGDAGAVSPEIHPVNLDYVLESWQMFPRTRGSESVEIAGLLAPGFDRADRDVLFLRTYAPPSALPAQPLYIRAAPVQRGETVYLIGCPYSQPGCSQNVYQGQITERSGGTFTFSLNSPLQLAGFSGAPVIDAKGHALGVLTAGYVSVEGGPATHGVAECLADLRNEIESRTPAAAPGGPLLAGASPTAQQVIMPGASMTPFRPQIPGSPQFAPSPFSPPAMDDDWKAELERQRQEMERKQREMQSRLEGMQRDSRRRMDQMQQDSRRRMDEMRQRMRGRR